MSKIHELFINQKLVNSVDLLFVPGQIEMVVGLKTNKPIIYYTDGTFSKMINYYWFGFSSKAIKEGNLMEKLQSKKLSTILGHLIGLLNQQLRIIKRTLKIHMYFHLALMFQIRLIKQDYQIMNIMV